MSALSISSISTPGSSSSLGITGKSASQSRLSSTLSESKTSSNSADLKALQRQISELKDRLAKEELTALQKSKLARDMEGKCAILLFLQKWSFIFNFFGFEYSFFFFFLPPPLEQMAALRAEIKGLKEKLSDASKTIEALSAENEACRASHPALQAALQASLDESRAKCLGIEAERDTWRSRAESLEEKHRQEASLTGRRVEELSAKMSSEVETLRSLLVAKEREVGDKNLEIELHKTAREDLQRRLAEATSALSREQQDRQFERELHKRELEASSKAAGPTHVASARQDFDHLGPDLDDFQAAMAHELRVMGDAYEERIRLLRGEFERKEAEWRAQLAAMNDTARAERNLLNGRIRHAERQVETLSAQVAGLLATQPTYTI